MSNNVSINEYTLAVITKDKNFKAGGSSPVFYVDNEEELQKKAMLMAKCVGGMVHDMTEGTLIIVKH